MEKQFERYLDLLLKIIESTSNDGHELTEKESDEFNELCKNLIEFLITNPGGLIFVENADRVPAYKVGIKILFDLYSSDELYEEILGGGFGGLMFDELDNYVYKAKKLIPTFISINPENREFYSYYNEAMRCWLYGLNSSSIIIIASLLENVLKNKINEFEEKEIQEVLKIIKADEKYQGVEISFERLIDIAVIKRIISEESKNIAHRLRKKRNKIVHNGESIDSNEALRLINKTKEIIEEMFN